MTAPIIIDGPMRPHFERGIALACDDVRAGVFRDGGPERGYLGMLPADDHDETDGPGVITYLPCATAEERAFLTGYSAVVWLLAREGVLRVSLGVPLPLLALSGAPPRLEPTFVAMAMRAASGLDDSTTDLSEAAE